MNTDEEPRGKPLLSLRGVSVRFGHHVIVDDVRVDFHPGTVTALVGPNGAGKTTLFNVISGQLAATAGQIELCGRRIDRMSPSARTKAGIGRIFQLSQLFPDSSVLQNVILAVQARTKQGKNIWSRADHKFELRERAELILERVGLRQRDQMASALTHCDKRKLEFALMLATEPSVLLLDEPTAGMSIEDVRSITDLIETISANQDRAILLVEHKLSVVSNLADRVIVLHGGRIIADGPPAVVMKAPEVRTAYFGVA